MVLACTVAVKVFGASTDGSNRPASDAGLFISFHT